MKLLNFIVFNLLCITFIQAQNNYFSEFDVDKTYPLKNNYSWNIGGNFKQQLNNDLEWSSPSLNVKFIKKLNSNWQIQAGVKNIFTRQQLKENFFELRPWISPRLNVDMIKGLIFQQALTFEARNFFYTENKENNEIQNRVRYKIHLDYKINKNKDRPDCWSINAGYEWFFLKEPNTGEQFSNLREFSLSLTKKFEKGNSLQLGYSFDKVNIFNNPNASNSHTYTLTYSF